MIQINKKRKQKGFNILKKDYNIPTGNYLTIMQLNGEMV
jgi:hypothetical protein